MGASAGWYWAHADSFADVWTGYYTDREPDSFFVAVRDGDVVGYLAGCADSRTAPTPAYALTRAFLRYGLFARPGTARFMWRGIVDALAGGAPGSGRLGDPRWPSHLHVNLLPEARGAGVGAALIDAWVERLRGLGSSGCHLGTLHENAAAITFFERMGFRRMGPPRLAPGLRTRDGGRHHLQFMVREL